MNGKVTYRQQYTRCGKQRCRKCKEGAGHGPYWYAYWSENGRTISKYIGINPPDEVANDAKSSASLSQGELIKEGGGTATAILGKTLTFQSGTNGATVVEAQKNSPLLRIYLLGQFRVERRIGTEWQTVANRTWQRRRARALLGCLLSQAGRRMGREQIMEALWPDLDIETAANRLNGAVHELRQILEPEIARPAASKMLRLERDILILADSTHIWVDAEAFEALLNRANATTDAKPIEQILEDAAALYGGDYLLEELYSEWAAPRRESLRRGWMGLLLELAELRAARGSLTSAIEPLDRLLTTDPTHETAVRRLMVLLTQLDRRGEAIRAYQRLSSILKRDYESEPLPETVELYKALRQGQIQASRPITGPLTTTTQVQVDWEKNTPGPLPTQKDTDHPTSHTKPDTTAPLALPQNLPRPLLPLGRQNQSPLIGRERELATLRQTMLAIDSISFRVEEKGKKEGENRERASNQARFIMLMGETGIGKTRLAEELSHEVQGRGWMVAWTRAYEQEGAIPYRPWTDILRTLLQGIPLNQLIQLLEGRVNQGTDLTTAVTAHARLGRLASLLPELAAHEEFHLQHNRAHPAMVPEQERFHLWESMLSLLSALSQARPLLIVMDDLHWTDDSSLELLAYLARHRQNERIMLIGTCRDRELSPSASLLTLLNDLRREQVLITLPLQPLTQAQIARLIAHLPYEVVTSIQSQAGGNPLFAEELARFSELTPGEDANTEIVSNHPSGSLDEGVSGKNSPSPLPETISAVLERRLSRLSTDCQTLLSKAAVLGGSFEFRLLMRMTGESKTDEDTTLDLLEEALHSGLLSEEVNGTRIVYHFWHPLIVSHLYKRLSAARRAQLHRRAAQSLIEIHTGNEAEVAAAIVYHLSRYGQEKQPLADYAEIAGNQAMALSAYPEALYHYRQALDALQALQTSSPAGQRDPMHIANLLECIAECDAMQGNFPEARQEYAQVLELHNSQRIDNASFPSQNEFQAWQQEEAQFQAMIWRLIGDTWRYTGDYAQTHACTQRGREVLRSAGITSGVAWAGLEHLDGGIYWAEGNFAEARRHVEISLEIHEQVMRKMQAQEQRDGGAAAKENTRASLQMTRSRRVLLGNPLDLGRARESLGVICASMGLYTEALQHLYAALEIYETHDLVGALSQLCSNIGAVHAVRADYETSRIYLIRALEVTERTGDVPSKVLITGNLGDVAGRTGDLQEAEAWLIKSVALAEQISDRDHISWGLVALSAIQQDLGNLRGALESIRRALVTGRHMKSMVRVGFALIALASWRTTRAIVGYNLEANNYKNLFDIPECLSLLHSAQVAAERALALEGVDSETQCIGQAALANVHLLLGNLDQAQHEALKTLEKTRQNETIYLIGRSQRLLGEIQAARGLEDEADMYFKQALQIFKQYGLRLEYARTLQRYGASLLQRDQQAPADQDNETTSDRGLEYLREAQNIFESCHASIDLQWVERILANPTHPFVRL